MFVEIGGQIEAIKKPEAKERQRAGGGDKRSEEAKKTLGKTFTNRKRDNSARTSAKAAKGVGVSHMQYEKAKAVVAAAKKNPAKYGKQVEAFHRTRRATLNSAALQLAYLTSMPARRGVLHSRP